RLLFAVGRSKIERNLQPPGATPSCTGIRHVPVGARFLDRPSCRKLLIGIGHYETARIELAGRLTDIFAIGGKRAIPRYVHAVDVACRFTMNHPLGQRLPDASALEKSGH